MARELSFLSVLDSLRDDSKPFSPRYLHLFSDLEPANLSALMEIWPEVTLTRKRALLEDLERLAEADTLISFDDLARALLNDDDAQIRVLAIRLLWECQDTKLATIFMDILVRDSDAFARAAAASALGLFVYLGEVEEIPKTIHHEVEEALLKVARSNDETLIRRRALEALGTSSRPEVPSLIEAAFDEKDPDWGVSALFAMGRSGDTRWEKQVLSKLRSKHEPTRIEAMRASGELSLARARPVLLNLLANEEESESRHEIIWALSKIGGEGVHERLEELLDTTEDDDEVDFLLEALDNLDFTEDLQAFDMFDFENKED